MKKQSAKKRYVLAAIAVLLFCGASLLVLEKLNITSLYTKSADNSAQRQREYSGEDSTINYGPPSPADQFVVPDKDPEFEVGEPVTNDLGIEMTRYGKSTDDTTLQIRAIVTGVGGGTCKATLTSGEDSVSVNGSVALVASQYSCVGLDIPTSQLAASSKWNLMLSVQSLDGQSATSSAEVIL